MDNKKIVDMNEEGSQSQLQEKYLQTLDTIEDARERQIRESFRRNRRLF